VATKAEPNRTWPPEPTTTPKIEIMIDPDADLEMLLPDTLLVSDFDDIELTGDETIDTEGTKRLSTKERRTTIQDAQAVPSRPTLRGLKAPAPTRQRTGPLLRAPNPGARTDRVPRRSPLDTEPTKTVDHNETTPFERDPLDTAQTPTVGSDRPPRKRR